MKNDKKFIFQKIIFPIIMSLCLVICINLFVKNKSLKHETLDHFESMIYDYEDINEDLNKISYQLYFKKDNISLKDIDNNMYEIEDNSKKIIQIFNLNCKKINKKPIGPIIKNLKNLKNKEKLTKSDKLYLKTVHLYTNEVLNIFETLEKKYPGSYRIDEEEIPNFFPKLSNKISNLSNQKKYKVLF